jgi:hypothetical protein
MTTNKPFRARRDKGSTSGFVVDGYKRAIDGIVAEIRSEIEEKYADEWKASGLIKRWKLSRKIEKEITIRVAERSKHVSPDALF